MPTLFQIPLLRLAIPFVFGMLIYEWFIHPNYEIHYFSYIITCSILVLLMVFCDSIPPYFGVFNTLLFVSFGMARIDFQHKRILTNDSLLPRNKTTLFVKITSAPGLKNWWKAEAELVRQNGTGSPSPNTTTKVMLYLQPGDDSQAPSLHDVIRLKSKISKIQGPTNPKAFNYYRFQYYRGIRHQIFAAKADWEITHKRKTTSPLDHIIKNRSELSNSLQTLITDHDAFSVVNAMLLGDNQYISKEIFDAYRNSGAVHVLAVSGLHVGIISWLVFLLIKFIFGNSIHYHLERILLVLLVIWFYAFLTGASPSVLRASFMFSCFFLGKAFKRNVHPLNSIGASAIVLLLLNPFNIFHLGFQFSYLAVLGIILLYPILKTCISKNTYLKHIGQAIAVSIAAQIFVLPLSVYYFHQVPVYFWLSSILILPFAPIIIGFGFFLLSLQHIIPALAIYLVHAYEFIVKLFLWGISSIDSLPIQTIDGLSLCTTGIVISYICIFIGIIFIQTRNPKSLIFLTALLYIQAIHCYHSFFKKRKYHKIIVYDISGETLINFIHGQRCYKIRSPRLDRAREELANKEMLIYQGIRLCKDISHPAYFFDKYISKISGKIQFGKASISISMDNLDSLLDSDLFILSKHLIPKSNLMKVNYKNAIVIDRSFSKNEINHLLKAKFLQPSTIHYTGTSGFFELKVL